MAMDAHSSLSQAHQSTLPYSRIALPDTAHGLRGVLLPRSSSSYPAVQCHSAAAAASSTPSPAFNCSTPLPRSSTPTPTAMKILESPLMGEFIGFLKSNWG